MKSGIATHFVPSSRLYELETLLSRCSNEIEIQALLNKFNEPSEEFTLADNIKHINYCFAAGTIEEIIERLLRVKNEWSTKTLEVCVKSTDAHMLHWKGPFWEYLFILI